MQPRIESTDNNMGNNNLKTVEGRIEEQYKALRKYYDEYYGEMTLIQHKRTGDMYARVDKTTFNFQGSNSQYLAARKKSQHKLLVPLVFAYATRVDMCSETETCIFLLEHNGHTLFEEIVMRQKDERGFEPQEAIQLFMTLTQCILLQRMCDVKEIPTNSHFIYKSPAELQLIEPLLYDKSDAPIRSRLAGEFPNNEFPDFYMSPEGFELYCRKENLKAKEIYSNEESLIFTIGMNFLECLLLVDLSELYDLSKRKFDHARLAGIIGEVEELYGDDIAKLLQSMTNRSVQNRYGLGEIQDYLRIISRNRGARLIEYDTPDFLQWSKKH